jgi:hypothetical protein
MDSGNLDRLNEHIQPEKTNHGHGGMERVMGLKLRQAVCIQPCIGIQPPRCRKNLGGVYTRHRRLIYPALLDRGRIACFTWIEAGNVLPVHVSIT